MFKNIIRNVIVSGIALATALTAMATLPALAFADNGLHLELDNNIHAHARIHSVMGENEAQENEGASFNVQNNLFDESVKAAQTTFNNAIKQANTTYKNALKLARNTFKASLKTAADASARIAALKVYLAARLDAFKARSAAIEAAFQAFINTNFSANQVPTANAQSVTVHENSSASITLTGSDPQNLLLHYTIVSNVSHGTLSGTAPTLTYTPAANFTGNDSFTFKVNNGSLDSATATVSITVNP